MDANGVTNDLFQAQTHIYKHMYGFIESMSLKCAISLGIPDIVHNHKRPITLLDLASSLNVPPSKTNSLERLMRILVHLGFFSTHEKVGYILTPCSKLLLKDNPTTLSRTVRAVLDPEFVNPWLCLGGWLLEASDHESMKRNHGLLDGDLRIVSSIIHQHGEVYEGLDSIVVVGDGDGTLARALCDKFPLMGCVVLELPQVVDGLLDEKKLKFVGGDMFEFVPSAEAVLIKVRILIRYTSTCSWYQLVFSSCSLTISTFSTSTKPTLVPRPSASKQMTRSFGFRLSSGQVNLYLASPSLSFAKKSKLLLNLAEFFLIFFSLATFCLTLSSLVGTFLGSSNSLINSKRIYGDTRQSTLFIKDIALLSCLLLAFYGFVHAVRLLVHANYLLSMSSPGDENPCSLPASSWSLFCSTMTFT